MKTTAIITAVLLSTAAAASGFETVSEASASERAAGNVKYSYVADEETNTIKIKSVTISDDRKEVTVPEEMDGKKVTEIGEKAFIGNLYVEKIVIPDSVTSIGAGAFVSCFELKEVSLGNGITEIPDDCFFSCPKLNSVILPEKLASIGNEAFFGCAELDTVIPETVVSIGNDALGKEADHHSEGSAAVPNFLIKGASGSVVEEYAAAEGIDFIDPQNYKAGDGDENGLTDADDASDVLSEYSHISTGLPVSFSKKKIFICDMDKNGLIDADDASTILRIYSELSTKG